MTLRTIPVFTFLARARAAKKQEKTAKTSAIRPKVKVCTVQAKNTILDNITIDRERNRTFQVFNEENQPEKG